MSSYGMTYDDENDKYNKHGFRPSRPRLLDLEKLLSQKSHFSSGRARRVKRF